METAGYSCESYLSGEKHSVKYGAQNEAYKFR